MDAAQARLMNLTYKAQTTGLTPAEQQEHAQLQAQAAQPTPSGTPMTADDKFRQMQAQRKQQPAPDQEESYWSKLMKLPSPQ